MVFCREIPPRLEPKPWWYVHTIAVVWRNRGRIPYFRELRPHFFVYAFIFPLSCTTLSSSSLVFSRDVSPSLSLLLPLPPPPPLKSPLSSASAATPTTTQVSLLFFALLHFCLFHFIVYFLVLRHSPPHASQTCCHYIVVLLSLSLLFRFLPFFLSIPRFLMLLFH